MGKLKDIAKTTLGVFCASTAKDAFSAGKEASTIEEKIALKATGSLAAATAFHLLKDDAIDTLKQVGLIKSDKKQIE